MAYFRFLGIAFFCLMIFPSTVRSQCICPDTGAITYHFNARGELLSGAPNLLKSGTRINIRVDFDSVTFKQQIDSIRANLTMSIVQWTIIRAAMTRNHSDPNLEGKADNLIRSLKSLSDGLKSTSPMNLLQLRADTCFPAYSPPKADPDTGYTPKAITIITELARQFEVRIECPDSCQFRLCLNKDVCNHYSYNGHLNTNCRDLSIRLYRVDPVKDLVINWYNSRAQHFDFDSTLMFGQILATDTVFQQVKAYFAGNSHSCDDSCKLRQLRKDWDSSVTRLYLSSDSNVLYNFAEWSLHFVWMNMNGAALLNPFPFTNARLYRQLSKDNSKPDQVASSISKKIDAFLQQEPLNRDTYKSFFDVYHKRDSINAVKDSLNTKNTGKTTQLALQNSQAYNAYEQVGFLVNRVKAIVSKDTPVHIRNYYYARLADKRGFRYEYPDDESIAISIHNIPAYNSLTVNNSIAVFNELPTITVEGSPSSASVAAVANGDSTLLSQPMKVNEFFYRGSPHLVQNKSNPAPCDQQKDPCPSFTDSLNSFQKDFALFKALDSIYSLSQYPPVVLEKWYNDSPRLRTETVVPDGTEKAPFEFDYKLYGKDTSKTATLIPIDSSYYKIGKRRYVELALGAAYSLTRSVNPSIDTSNGGFRINNAETRAQFIVGLKFHLRGIYWGNNHLIFTKGANTWKNIEERLSLLIAVSIPSPLSNIYAGAGIDLIPGLNLNAGVRWYSYNKYRINNNQITDQNTTFRGALYMSVTADPTLCSR
jgi:hypothetical protein